VTQTCIYPFSRAHLSPNGNVYVCCSAWLNKPIGNFLEKDITEIWNSEAAARIRESIFDGSFRFCNKNVCPRIVSGQIEKEIVPVGLKAVFEEKNPHLKTGPEHLSLNYDNTCNLSCKSCRERVRMLDPVKIQRLIHFQDALLDSSLFKEVRRVVVTGAGEPFASKVFMDFFRKLDENKYPQLKITLRTNGILLLPGIWEEIKNAHYDIDTILVSIDAATKETYQKLRNGGNFDRLLKNLEFLARLKQTMKLKVGFNFVIQEANYEEMPAFVEMAWRFDCDEVTFTQLMNLGTYTPEEYERLAVHRPEHPKFQKLKEILRESIFRDSRVSLNNLSHLVEDEAFHVPGEELASL
jgi:MoaA/NifB/PqqE/SkfB family radical SAM enzyme